MINEHVLSRLCGGLFFLSNSMKDDKFTYTSSATFVELDRDDILASYSKEFERHQSERRNPRDIMSFSNLSKKKKPLKFLDKYFTSILIDRIGNHGYVAWHLLELIHQICDYEMPEEIYTCDSYRELYEEPGRYIFIPLQGGFLILSGASIEKLTKQQYEEFRKRKNLE